MKEHKKGTESGTNTSPRRKRKQQQDVMYCRVFPDSPETSPRCHRPIVTKEESLLGTFIQWVNNKPNKQKRPASTAELTLQLNKGQDENQSRNIGDGVPDVKAHNAAVNGFKGNKKDGKPDKKERSSRLQDIKNHLKIYKSSSLLKDVHVSRPATPQPCSTPQHTARGTDEKYSEPEFDRYRVMYLIVIVEQQQEHIRKILTAMRSQGADRSRVKEVVIVQEALQDLNYKLLRVRDKDQATLRAIGTEADLYDFYLDVENICSSVEEISCEDGEISKAFPDIVELGFLGRNKEVKDGKVKIRRKKKTSKSPPSVNSVFPETKDIRGNCKTPLPLKHTNTRSGLDRYRSRGKPVYKTTPNTDAKQELYTDTREQLKKGQYPCDNMTIDPWSDTDTDEEFSIVDNSNNAKWPAINIQDEKNQERIKQREAQKIRAREDAKDNKNAEKREKERKRRQVLRLKRDQEMDSLMEEIDNLMFDVNEQKANTDISYETVMMGGQQCRRRKGNNKPKASAARKETEVGVAKNVGKEEKNQSDVFFEELDKLLDECEV